MSLLSVILGFVLATAENEPILTINWSGKSSHTVELPPTFLHDVRVYPFLIVNETEGDLQVQSIDTTCGCISVEKPSSVFKAKSESQLLVRSTPLKIGKSETKVTIKISGKEFVTTVRTSTNPRLVQSSSQLVVTNGEAIFSATILDPSLKASNLTWKTSIDQLKVKSVTTEGKMISGKLVASSSNLPSFAMLVPYPG